jgi:hypothetical protein
MGALAHMSMRSIISAHLHFEVGILDGFILLESIIVLRAGWN